MGIYVIITPWPVGTLCIITKVVRDFAATVSMSAINTFTTNTKFSRKEAGRFKTIHLFSLVMSEEHYTGRINSC